MYQNSFVRYDSVMNNIRRTKPFPMLLIGCLTLALLAAAGIFITKQRKQCNEIQCIRLSLLKNPMRTDVTEKTDKSFLALYTYPSYLIRVEKRSGLSSHDAETLSKVTIMRMQGQFETARSPYPGILSDAITCDKKFDINPQTIQHGPEQLTFFTGFLNNRTQYGSCIESEIAYTGLNAIIYCDRQHSWYRLEALVPQTSNQDISALTKEMQNISCQ